MNNIMKDTWNFIFNKCQFNYANDKSIYTINRLHQPRPYDIYQPLQIKIKEYFNLSNLEDLFDEHYKNEIYWKNNLFSDVLAIYTEEINISISDKNNLSLILFNQFLNTYRWIYLKDKEKTISDFNKIIAKYNLYFEEGKFYVSSPISESNLNILTDILNLSDRNKNKYKNVLETYKEAHYKFNNEEYYEVILYSFSALESLVKIILDYEKLSIETNFKKNTTQLLTINKFNEFKLLPYFESLSCIRNNHCAHGNIEKHIEDINLSKFYLYSIGNTIVYIINSYES